MGSDTCDVARLPPATDTAALHTPRQPFRELLQTLALYFATTSGLEGLECAVQAFPFHRLEYIT